jgi:catalase (peroxidase I)
VLDNILIKVKGQFGDSLSFADLMVLAGNVAVEDASGLSIPFCGGRR